MDTQKFNFNRVLLTILVILYLLTITAFSYANWAADPDYMKWWMILLNILILSIPLVLLFGSVYVLILAWREYKALGEIKSWLVKIIHWAPRLAAVSIIFFISLFSFDVFEMEASPLEKLGGFFMHSIPSIAMIVLLILAWKRPAIGFIAFLTAAILFALRFVRGLYSIPNLLLFVLPLLLVAFLFYVDWKWLKTSISPQIDSAA